MNDIKSSSKAITWVAIVCGGLVVLALMFGCFATLFLGVSTTRASSAAASSTVPTSPTPR